MPEPEPWQLILSAIGLAVIFGMMGVINFAHSALFMLGAYVGLVATTRLGSFWLGLLIAPPAIGPTATFVDRSACAASSCTHPRC